MATEYPPLGKTFVLSYSENDRNYPILAIRKDPRVDNYKIPENLSPHPDSTRWPNHVFIGTQPTNTDERVLWIYEILPAPQLVSNSTNNSGQLVTITTQKKSQKDYVPPSPSATRTVETTKEGVESVIERIIDAPQLFDSKLLSASKPEVIPERFRAKIPSETEQEIVEQSEVTMPALGDNELEKTEERVTEFTVRKSTVTRNVDSTPELNGIEYEESFDVQIPYTEKISNGLPASTSSEAVPLDDERYLVREYDRTEIESYLDGFLQSYPTTINMNLPKILSNIEVSWDEKRQSGSYENTPSAGGAFTTFSTTDRGEASQLHSITPLVNLRFIDIWSQNIPATVNIFFLKNPITKQDILDKLNVLEWPIFKPQSYQITGLGVEIRSTATAASSVRVDASPLGFYVDQSKQTDYARSTSPVVITIPPCLNGGFVINQTKPLKATSTAVAVTAALPPDVNSVTTTATATMEDEAFIKGIITPTSPTGIPTSGKYLIDSSIEFFKYGFSLVKTTTIDATIFA